MTELWYYLLICLGGALVFLIGNLTIGKRREGGKRFILFIGGAGAVLLAAITCSHFLGSPGIGPILGSIFGFAIWLLGAAMIITSILGSDDAVHYLFEAVLRGL